ncbi:class A beta-lactamase-related serine hydrolase [Niabella sp. CC-SYL272]|uniref:serine hydrolase n=1 Tax=Niabella agricola TaxID=2891571 RepID=UPI001F16094D|nr:serine hydrolase [Niabella agricola]MCF3110714.1 class A beta-lactamase-related serine hydrolase [Niabella agricola]
MKPIFLLFLCTMSAAISNAQVKTDPWLKGLLEQEASPLLKSVLEQPEVYQYQLIYTEIKRDAHQKPSFINHYLNVDRNRYFNPASTVKMPVAFAALEKLNRLEKTVSPQTPMLTDSAFSAQTAVTKDTTSKNGLPSIEHYIKKIFLVSDNDAYNRLYEFTGQKTLNESLWKKGYQDIRITRRFVPMTPEENRHTNPVRFVKDGKTLYSQPAAYSDLQFRFPATKILVGNGHWDKNDSLINEPMDFTGHNNLPLEDGHMLLRSVLFPQSVPAKQRFYLTADNYRMLYTYMSELPYESRFPAYDTSEFFSSYTKFFFFRAAKEAVPDHIRVFNKAGWSYGFLTDYCYVVDFKNNLEFMLSATIYVNKDGILNDNKYEYEETGYPFFKEVGQTIYKYELTKKKTVIPDLSRWKFTYD